jgi:hypothetical protein
MSGALGANVEGIELAETLEALRASLASAVSAAAGESIEFPVAQVQLEFQVGVTKTRDGKVGVRFWVLELGAGGAHAAESLQKVTITLDPPVDREGRPIRVTRPAEYKP